MTTATITKDLVADRCTHCPAGSLNMQFVPPMAVHPHGITAGYPTLHCHGRNSHNHQRHDWSQRECCLWRSCTARVSTSPDTTATVTASNCKLVTRHVQPTAVGLHCSNACLPYLARHSGHACMLIRTLLHSYTLTHVILHEGKDTLREAQQYTMLCNVQHYKCQALLA